MSLLKATGLGITFGGLKAVSDVDFDIKEGELVGLIGPNGAGKTTFFNLLTGVYQPTEGDIEFNGKSILGNKPYQINNLGIARTFQNIRLFKDLSVLDNVKIAYNSSMKYGAFTGIFRLPKYFKEEKEADERAIELLKVFNLDGLIHEKASNLPYGKQRKLEIARALASNPKLLLLDEPAAGMNPSETAELMETISIIRKNFNTAILLIEHDMGLVMGICERLFVLEYGMLIASGEPQEVINNPRVIAAYLGD
ncbi:ABC transporter ATP-binding protein [uncultured Tyzzerella sp.]|uniref:ABC transporter ATP-binding protein n=1 Tax=uncultured Tyzzerella sp. TaxID=2321398 RepID=UPI0029422455|nr:ABC transporter ATP-binding protein [uncultured Tyzzerella sp.]